jgi:hypothetical protein
MVLNKLTLTNNYVHFHNMLKTSKTLNTSNTIFYSNKVKDITMRYKQEAKNGRPKGWLSLMPHLWRCMHLFGILIDYMWKIIQKFSGWLRYSPAFCTHINLFKKSFMSRPPARLGSLWGGGPQLYLIIS